MKRSERLRQRREEAKSRNAAWAKLTPKQQLKVLDQRGHTATRQRAKIKARIEAEKAAKKAAEQQAVSAK